MQNEIVYILINEAMQGYCKIGRTIDLEQRMRSLDNTSVPLPFECFYACTVSDAGFVEKQLHDAFGDNRVRSNREWFEIAPERVASALRIAQIDDVTPNKDFVESADDQKALDKARERRSTFNFAMVNIPTGSILTFVNRPEVFSRVLDNRRVEFNGEDLSITRAAQIVLGHNRPIQGPLYWEYEGETLVERRLRMEQEG
ncbi:MAG TPA: GIY-YIG nuclease family protein [bacterium]|nr:GIY-YIG nuclease family protein [bacterium]